jgi:hypothetical protein
MISSKGVVMEAEAVMETVSDIPIWRTGYSQDKAALSFASLNSGYSGST